MTKGDIILINFPFTDLSGIKLRPAIVLLSNNEDCTVCFVTTQKLHQELTDIELNPSEENGIKLPSLIKPNKRATLRIDLAKGKSGSLNLREIDDLNSKLITIFQLIKHLFR